jgi:hypothetical protein
MAGSKNHLLFYRQYDASKAYFRQQGVINGPKENFHSLSTYL